MVMGFVQFLTTGLMLSIMIGARNTVPSSTARMVPLGLFHIWCRWYSSTRWALGVMVAHLTATPYFCWRGRHPGHLILSGIPVGQAQIVVLGLQIHKGQDELLLDDLPEHTGHLVAIHLHQRAWVSLDLFHNSFPFL